MVVAGAAGKGPPLNGFPELILQIVFGIVYGGNTALGAVKRFMGRAGHDVCSLLEGLLEIRAHQPEHMGHVIHQHTIQFECINDGAHFLNRFFMDDHAFAQDNQLRAVFGDQFPGGFNINFKRIVF